MSLIGGLQQPGNAERRSAKDLLATVLWDSNDAIILHDFDRRILAWNRGAELLYGYSEAEVLGEDILRFIPESRHEEIRAMVERLRRGDTIASFETQRVAKDGRVLDIWLVISGIHDVEGVNRAFITTERDTTHRNATEAALKTGDETERRIQKRTGELEKENKDLFDEIGILQVTLACIGDAVITTDVERNITFLNPTAEKLTGWKNSEVLGLPLVRVFRIVNESSREPAEDPVRKCLADGQVRSLASDTSLIRRDGREISIDDTAAPIFDRAGKMVGAILIFRDVTEKRDLVRELAHQADHDPLTGLSNRREFERRLNGLLASRDRSNLCCLLFLDLDQFKIINDTSGHAAGDALLCQVSSILRSKIRRDDMLARLGGDEFGVLLEHCPVEQAVRIADQLLRAVQDLRFQWAAESFAIGVSIGVVAIGPGDNSSSSSLLSDADTACYVAKQQGRNRLHVYDVGGGTAVQQRSDAESMPRISDALRDDHFRLYYQPIMPLQAPDGRGHRGEILLRLLDRDNHPLLPESFLPAAERYKQMVAIDRWVVGRSLSALRSRKAGAQPIVYSINISGQSLSQEEFLPFVIEQFRSLETRPESVCFEITETAAIANLAHAIKFITVLRERGCQFALDDFGVGLSSFAYLKTLPVDYVKIAGCFITGMVEDPVDRAMVEAIHRIGRVMGIHTIAESVENQATIDLVTSIGLDYAQGYGIARPLPLEQSIECEHQFGVTRLCLQEEHVAKEPRAG